jgi:hypothetical protein
MSRFHDFRRVGTAKVYLDLSILETSAQPLQQYAPRAIMENASAPEKQPAIANGGECIPDRV